MYKTGEANWADKVGAINRRTPFGDANAGVLLAQMGAIILLMPPPPAKVLDAGCACGRLTHFLQMQGYQATGADVCAGEIEWARTNPARWSGQESAPEFMVCDFDHLPSGFDVVIFADALHHSVNRKKTLQSAFAALNAGGILIACEPGVGHGWTKVSREWSRSMNVTERSCPPFSVVWSGWQAGFRNPKVYAHPTTAFGAAYSRGGHIRENRIMALFRSVPTPLSWIVLSVLKWAHGITVMQKPIHP